MECGYDKKENRDEKSKILTSSLVEFVDEGKKEYKEENLACSLADCVVDSRKESQDEKREKSASCSSLKESVVYGMKEHEDETSTDDGKNETGKKIASCPVELNVLMAR